MSVGQIEEVTNGQFRFEDGEMVLSDTEPSQPDRKDDADDAIGSRKNRRKQTFERRNIKKVREDTLNEEARAAQQAEMERRKRLEKDQVDRGKFSNIEFLLTEGGTVMDDCLPTVPEPDAALLGVKLEEDLVPSKRFRSSECPVSFDSTMKLAEEVKDDPDGNILKTPPLSPSPASTKLATGTFKSASESLFGLNQNNIRQRLAGQTCDDAILLGDSDEDVDKPTDSVVIELSDGEDGVENEEEPEVETEICELQDAGNLTDEHGRVVVNPNRDAQAEPEIYLPHRIARVIKPHQVSGIRFLYDNLIESLPRFSNSDGFGCILAHSMGLGKTIQIIGFLEVIFRHCSVQRVLVIVPINTIQNWQHEFEIWLPTDQDIVQLDDPNTDDRQSGSAEGQRPDGGTSPKCEAAKEGQKNRLHHPRPFKLFVVRDVIKTMTLRHQIISQWYKEGGVLLLGYEMFRLLLNQKRLMSGHSLTKAEMRAAAKRKKKNAFIDLEKDEKLKQMWSDFYAALLEPGPQLVICDEGHRIKNSEASISKALKAIKTRRRVVLTGYPLQNNLMEYWCMVDFVRPNYLGTKQEFTNMFQRPIENGQCIDSTPEDRKVMQGRAHVLHDLLSGFVQRRSHAVLKASLPPKTEIVLLIKLSPLQRRLYAAFMRTLNSHGPLGWAQVNTLKTYAMCCKIWNHPDILWRAMEEHKETLDFDIDDPSASSSSNSTYSTRSLHRSTTTSTLTRTSSSNTPTATSLSPSITPDSSSTNIALASVGQFPPTTLNNSMWSLYAQQQLQQQQQQQQLQQQLPQFVSSNPLFQALQPGMLACQSLTSSPSMPILPYPQQQPPLVQQQQQTQQVNAHTYDWASDSSLWGEDFQPGTVDHSGKIVLFLSLLEGCVLAGDKLLVFTQSLYTLDLLERILRRLPLPKKTEVDGKSGHYGPSEADIDGESKHGLDDSNTTKNDQDLFNDSSLLSNLEPLPVDKLIDSTSLQTFCSDQISNTMAVERLNDTEFVEKLLVESGNLNASSAESVGHTPGSEVPPISADQQQDQEENYRSLHYRLASQLSRSDNCTVWTKNVHYFRLDGSTTASEREKLINHFNDPSNPAKLFLVSTRAGCLGVNLIGANRVVVFDASWNPCHDCQAVCRVYRYGQMKPCYIYRLVSDNTMEKKIYDRQVTKQGMSDRVVDELNPLQQFTRNQVELLMSFEDKDMPTLTDEDVQACNDLVEPDPVLASVLNKHKSWITKIPFTHESLLIDHKNYRLTRVEKRLARQRYEQEKRLSLSYQRAHMFQYQQMQFLQQQQLLAAGINPSLVDQSRLFGNMPNMFNRGGYRPTYTSGMAAIDAMRQVQNFNRNPDCKVTRVVATSDLFFPSSSGGSSTDQRKIPKGEVLEVIQTSKGKYLRIIRTGDLFVVKTAANSGATSNGASATASASANATVDLTDSHQSQPRTTTTHQQTTRETGLTASNRRSHSESSLQHTISPTRLPATTTNQMYDSSQIEMEKERFSSDLFSHSVSATQPNTHQGTSVAAYLGQQSNDASGTTREFAHAQPSTAPPSVPHNSNMFSFDQQPQQQFRAQSVQDQQSPISSWLCSTCGRSPLSGCSCQISHPSTVAMGHQAHISKVPSEDLPKIPNYSQHGQFYEPSISERQVQQQRQQQYIRAAEEAARQSAAAYANFTRQQQQQLTASTTRPDISSTTVIPSSNNQQSTFQGSSTAAVVQDYVTQLTNQQTAQQAMISLQNTGAFSHHPNPMAAAVQHYLSSGQTPTSYPTRTDPINCSSGSQNDPNRPPINPSSSASQQPLSAQAFLQPPTSGQTSSHTFDNLQSTTSSQPLTQNFRFS